jgi:hypothetical protein
MLDPRDEAARLSHLTKEAAAEQLARISLHTENF